MKRVLVLLITSALLAGMVGCTAEPEPTPPVEYSLTVSSSDGGEVTTPGEGIHVYSQGEVVSLVAASAGGYYFGGWIGDVSTIANTRAASTTITMNGDYSITATFQLIPVAKYDLTVSSTEGGSVTGPGEGTFTYDAGTVVDLVAETEEGYQFAHWTGSVGAVDDVSAASTTVTMMGDYSITANFAKEVRTWYDLDAIRDNLNGHYALMNDLDSTTPGYAELAGPMANDGKGWQPIGSVVIEPFPIWVADPVQPFAGCLNGQGHKIMDLFIDRHDEDGVGLIGSVGMLGVVENVGVVNAEVTGRLNVGSLVGSNDGAVASSCSDGSVSGREGVGGLIGLNHGALDNSYSHSAVTGEWAVGGLVGFNTHDGISNSFSTGRVNGYRTVGGLVGHNDGPIRSSFSTGSLTGQSYVGGLVGFNNWGTIVNSYYDHGEVLINGENVITIGALFSEDFEQWLSNAKFLDVNERLSKEDGYYAINSLGDLKQLLAFGQDGSLKFRLRSDLDLTGAPNFYIPYLAGEFDGNGHMISNLSVHHDCVSHVGLFGVLAAGGVVREVAVESANLTGAGRVGGLVGASFGTVKTCYSRGNVAGHDYAGGLVGSMHSGTLTDSYSVGSVSGHTVGGLVGWNYHGAVRNAHYDYDEVLINGENVITIGALFSEDFEQWLSNAKFLDVNERLSKEDGYYAINSLGDLEQLLAFGQDGSLKFRLRSDLDLTGAPNFYVPYLAGEFDGNGHIISNLSVNYGFVTQVGAFGYLASGGKITQVGVDSSHVSGAESTGGLVGYSAHGATVVESYFGGSVTGSWHVGGLVGRNMGTINSCYSIGSVTGHGAVGGLVGEHSGTMSNCYSGASASGGRWVGGLAGLNWQTVMTCYSTGGVTGGAAVGGLVGANGGTVSRSFWDADAAKMETSDGGTGKTTAEMKSIDTFRGTGWSIVGVAPGGTDRSRTWNIVDGQTYPFLSWQPVS